MTDDEYIRKAVEMADGWLEVDDGAWFATPFGHLNSMRNLHSAYYDALAAQLVRQCTNSVIIYDDHTTVWGAEVQTVVGPGAQIIALVGGPDRTMNTIRAIVGSGVLTEQDRGE